MTRNRWFWVAVALQVLLLLGVAGRHGYTLVTGVPVRLQTAPVDPWDYLRGEYVRLNYTISTLQDDGHIRFDVAEPLRSGQAVWVTLRPADPVWAAVAVSDRKPAAPGGGEVVLRGTVQWAMPSEEINPPHFPARTVTIRYGIEQLYVPEGEGADLERRNGQMVVEARVDRFGRAALQRVFLDGKEIRWR